MNNESTKEHNERISGELCDAHGCNDKLRKLHFKQIVHQAWNPHPSPAFIQWWQTQPDYQNGIDAVHARNCKCYCDQFKEARQIGAV
jgi:hypothetical protein